MTREDLKREFGATDYYNGESYFRENRVSQLEIQHIRQTVRVFAVVKGHALNSYAVTVEVGERSIASNCTCPRCYSTGQCKHIVAVLIAYLNSEEKKKERPAPANRPARRSDGTARDLLSAAEQLAISGEYTPQAQEEAPVTLMPELSLGISWQGQAQLGLNVGRERLYVVRKLEDFLHAMKTHETVSYGKGLTFCHRPELLDGRSRALYDLVLECREERKALLTEVTPCPEQYTIGRTILLPPHLLDKLFSLYTGQRVKLLSSRETVLFSEQQPELTAVLASEPDGMSLTLLKNGILYQGAERQYLYDGKTLFPCAPELAQLVQALRRGQWSHYETDTIFFSSRDLPSLASTLLPVLRRHFTVEGDEEALEAYAPDTPVLRFYLDWNGREILARLRAAYGDKEVSVFDESAGRGLRRNRLAERRGINALERWFPERDTFGLCTLTDEERIFAFCQQGVEELQACGEVYSSATLRQLCREQPKVSVGVSVSGNLLDLEIDAGDFPMSELVALAEAVRNHKKYYRMKDGGFLSLEESGSLSTLASLKAGLGVSDRAFASGSVSVPLYRALYLDESLRDAEQLRYSRDDGFRKLVRSFRTVADSDYVLPEQYRKILRPYQKTGFRWLKTLAQYGFGGILADDMGLGKTVQALSYLSSEKEAGNPLPSLVVCPASLVLNWGDECRKFAPELRVQLLYGTAAERAAQWDSMNDCDLAVISYDSLRRDAAQLKKYSFHTCILDEAQYIKNHTTLSFQTVKQVNARHRFAMTGTPVENRLSELWSIFDFLMPGYLYRYREFQSRIEKPAAKDKDEEALSRLARLTRPFLLRRMKADVLKELPPKTESVRYVSLNEEQRKLYTAVALDGLDKLRREDGEGKGKGQEKLEILVLLMRLRQICCDPRLCLDEYTGESAKLESCMELVSEAVESGHHILLFSQFTSMLELLRQRLEKEGISSFVLQGSTPKSERASLVKRFNAGEAEVFLISLKAGGTGLNLTGADTVIHYDPWWNDAAQNQATDRAYRIGQKNAVQVYRLIGKDTIEEKILDLQERKRALADAVAGTETGILSLSREELLELLQV